MKAVVVGLGTQGKKRKKILKSKKSFVTDVDPFSKEAKFNFLEEVDLNTYDTCFLCVPDEEKIRLIKYCIKNNKHILVEKPLSVKKVEIIKKISNEAKSRKIVIYTAYNHRFEPHFKKMRSLIEKKKLGKIYSCRIFYGNGTARLVKKSSWRDKGSGVLHDLAPHLLDTCKLWFGKKVKKFKIISVHRFENKSPDHVIIQSVNSKIFIELEMTLCMWKNYFSCDIIGEKGSAHIENLCKWGPSKFIHRKRILPSGKPYEKKITLKRKDPTWEEEHRFFQKLINDKKNFSLNKDFWILDNIHSLEKKINV